MPQALCVELLAIEGGSKIYNRGELYQVPAAIFRAHRGHFLKVENPSNNKNASRVSEDK